MSHVTRDIKRSVKSQYGINSQKRVIPGSAQLYENPTCVGFWKIHLPLCVVFCKFDEDVDKGKLSSTSSVNWSLRVSVRSAYVSAPSEFKCNLCEAIFSSLLCNLHTFEFFCLCIPFLQPTLTKFYGLFFFCLVRLPLGRESKY